jgi:4-oxalocrotonate tautomerase family enzyme
MPVVHIYMYKGRTKEQKNELVKRISKDFEEGGDQGKTGVAQYPVSRHR